MEKEINGLTAYDILEMDACPFKLPKATSMTQAALDYKHIEDRVFEWYNNQEVEKEKNFKKQ